MPTKLTIAADEVGSVPGRARSWAAVSNLDATQTVYVSFDGVDPTDADGAAPGIPLPAQGTVSCGVGEARDANDKAIKIYNPAANNANIVSVQEV